MQFFKDDKLNERFIKNGYVVVPLLSQTEIAGLLKEFSAHRQQYDQTFHTSHFSSNIQYKQQVHDSICAQVFPAVSQLLVDFKPVFGNFMIKKPGGKNSLQLHADWAYVDEEQFQSIAVWVPLVDTNLNNGCLGVVPGSHVLQNHVRGPMIHQTSFKFDEYWTNKAGKLLPVKAGTAVIYDHRLMHYSLENKTDKVRPALNLSLVPAKAQMLHYCLPQGGDMIEKYAVPDTDFFIHYQSFQKPEKGTLVDKIPLSSLTLIDERMNAWVSKLPWYNKLKNKFEGVQ